MKKAFARCVAAASLILCIFFALPLSAPAQAAVSPNSASANTVLSSNQKLVSPDGRFQAIMQDDGNFVVYGPSGANFWTSTFAPGSVIAMQGDGNLVVYSGGRAVYASMSSGSGATLNMQNDGNLVIYSGGKALWSSRYGLQPATYTQLNAGQVLRVGDAVTSPSGAYRAIMQGDGNFVVYGPSGPTFWTGTFAGPGSVLAMQGDGNLVLYAPSGPAFATWTVGTSASLVMQDDGNLVLYSDGKPLWSSRYGRASSWRLSFSDDFSAPVGLGGFTSSGYGSRYYTYSGGDTYGGAVYDTSRVVSVGNGVLDMFLHNENGQAYSAAIVPQSPRQIYGRYEVRFRADAMPYYGAAFLLWPDSNNWNEGEIDFPEAPFAGTIAIHNHCVGHTQDSCYDVYTGVSWTSWHTAVTEWTPRGVTFYLDDQVVGFSPVSPSSPMHMVIQTGKDSGGSGSGATAAGHLQIDYIKISALV